MKGNSIIPAGFVFSVDGQRYELVGFGISDAGNKFFIWKAKCYDCGKEFRANSGMTFKVNRRCDACKKPGVRVTGKKPHLQKGYRKAFEAMEGTAA